MNELVRCALSGTATGGRTMTGLAVLTATTPSSAQTQPDRTLRLPAAAVPIGLLAVTELVLDKLPQTPSRLEAPGLIGRGVTAALCGVIVARREWPRPDRPEPPGEPIGSAVATSDPKMIAACVTAATGAALGAAWLGVWCRGVASRRLGSAWLAAVIEDAAVVALATAAAR